jgi:hypothetical protein
MTMQTILERAEALGWPLFHAGGASYKGEGGWRQFGALAGYAPQLSAQLDELETKAADEASRQTRLDADDRRRAEALRPDPELEGQIRIEAEVERQAFEARRPERIEALLGRIVAALERQAK